MFVSTNYIVVIISVFQWTVLSTKVIDVYALTSLDSSAAAAYRLAFEYINNNEPDLLSDHNLQLITLNTEGDTTIALQKVLEIKKNIQRSCPCTGSEDHNISVPIVLGQRSSTCSIAAPVLETIHWAQISSSATSILLSDNNKYPTFYRTISDDSLQAAGIVEILKYFQWTKVAVIYVNDVYGAYLAIEIMHLASTDPNMQFEVAPIAYNYGVSNKSNSIKLAVTQLRNTGVFVTVLVVHSDDLLYCFQELENQGLWGYPYYYLGVDTWMDIDLTDRQVTRFTEGYLGTTPWTMHMLSAEDYSVNEDVERMYNASSEKLRTFDSFWMKTMDSMDDAVDTRSVTSYYGWDSAYTIAHVVQRLLDSNISLDEMPMANIQWIDDIMTDSIAFMGVTGNVTFKKNGDRDRGLFAFGNILKNGSMSPIGYFSEHYNVTHFDYGAIHWPSDFMDRDMIPRTSVLIRYELLTIHSTLFLIVASLAIISILSTIGFMVLTAVYSKDSIMKAASWKLNLAVCIGVLMTDIFVIISGLDESLLNETHIQWICTIKLWLLSISFTLGAVSLFLKTYRVSVIFSEALKTMQSKTVTDFELACWLMLCVVIDIVVLSIQLVLSPRFRHYENGSTKTIDQLQMCQYQFAVCSTNDTMMDNLFKSIIAFWKMLQILFGIYCCSIVIRISDARIRQTMRRFDETSTQLVAVVTIILLTVAVLLSNALIPGEYVNWRYGLQSAGILVICNVCLYVNLCPRLIAIWKGDQDKYRKSLAKEMMVYVEEKMKKFWASRPRTPSQSHSRTFSFSFFRGGASMSRLSLPKTRKTHISNNSSFDSDICSTISTIAEEGFGPKDQIDKKHDMTAKTESKRNTLCVESIGGLHVLEMSVSKASTSALTPLPDS